MDEETQVLYSLYMLTPINLFNPLSTLRTSHPPLPLQRLQRSLQRLVVRTLPSLMFRRLTSQTSIPPAFQTTRSLPINTIWGYERVAVLPRAIHSLLGTCIPLDPLLLVPLPRISVEVLAGCCQGDLRTAFWGVA